MQRLTDHWIWDSWVADDGDRYHLFLLKAPKSLGDPSMRHTAAVIGHASSADLVEWVEHADALRPSQSGWDDLALWTGSVTLGDGWHLLIAARATGAPRYDDGVLAHARSADMRAWELGPPICDPGAGFGQLEVPQVRVVDDVPMLVFTCHPDEQSAERQAANGPHCTWTVPGDSMLGPWDTSQARPFRPEPKLFAAPLVRSRDGGWVFVGFRHLEPDGVSPFEIIDPIAVRREGAALVRR